MGKNSSPSAWAEEAGASGKAWDWLGGPHCSFCFHIRGFPPTHFPSTLQILLNLPMTYTALGLLSLSPLELQLQSLGRGSLGEVPGLVLPGLRKRSLFWGWKWKTKTPHFSLCLSSLEISTTDLHRCAESEARRGRHWPRVPPSRGRSPASSRTTGTCSSFLGTHRRDWIAMWGSGCDREWQAGPQFGVVIPEP